MLKVGIFGVGHLGKIHIQQWREIPGVELIGFYDPDEQHAEETSSQFNLKRFDHPDDLIEASEAVDIVTTTTSHFEIAKSCLLNSKHLFIEKPMTETVAEAQALVELVKEANVKCQVGHVERYNPAILALAGRKVEPMFVEAHRLSEFNPRGTDVGVVLDLMIHDIDVLLHFVHSPVKRIAASGVPIISDTIDIANARIEFDNGCVANLTASRISLKKMRRMRLFQPDAYIGIDFLKKETEIIRLKGAHEKSGLLDFPIDLGDGRKKIISIEKPNVGDVNAIREELASFTLSILRDTPVAINAVNGLNALEVAHKILNKVALQNQRPATEETKN